MKKVYSQKSGIHGMGLFAGEDILKGQFISCIKGKLKTVDKDLLFTEKEAYLNPDWVGFSKRFWIDPFVPFKHLNHSCEPSCGLQRRFSIYARRNIKAGEEITIDYSTVEANPYWVLHCECGSKRCRRKIRSIAFLPVSLIKSYYPYIPSALYNFYLKSQGGLRKSIKF